MINSIKAWYWRFVATKYGAVINRIVIAAVLAGAGRFAIDATADHLFSVGNFLDISLWHVVVASALTAAYASVLTALQSLVSLIRTGAPQFLAIGKARFKARRAALSGASLADAA